MEEDHPEPKEKPRPKKLEPRPLSPASFDKFIGYLVECDHIIPKTAAFETKLPLRVVATCINICLERGLILPISKFPTHDEKGDARKVWIGPIQVMWEKGNWQHFEVDYMRWRENKPPECNFRKMKPEEWDGLAYRVNDEEVENLKHLRADPRTWECLRCGTVNPKPPSWARHTVCTCCKRDPMEPFSQPPRVCPKCQAKIKTKIVSGKRREYHTPTQCNMNQVNEILSG